MNGRGKQLSNNTLMAFSRSFSWNFGWNKNRTLSINL